MSENQTTAMDFLKIFKSIELFYKHYPNFNGRESIILKKNLDLNDVNWFFDELIENEIGLHNLDKESDKIKLSKALDYGHFLRKKINNYHSTYYKEDIYFLVEVNEDIYNIIVSKH